MKKRLPFILFSLISIFLSGCKNGITVTETNLKKRPDIEYSEGGITLTARKIGNDEDYIIFYRRNVTSEKSDSYDKALTVNVGLIYTSALDQNNAVYIFEDTNLDTESKYQFMARYHEKSGKYYDTAWTDPIQPKNGTPVKYDNTGVSFSYSESSKTLTLSSALNRITEYSPMLAVSNGEKALLFETPFNSETDEFNYIYNLAEILPSDFLDTEITILGIVGQKTEYVDPEATDKVIKKYIWTEPYRISISGNSNNTLTITSANGSTGIDYSKPE